MSVNASELAFCCYAALVGMALACLFLICAATPVIAAFFVSAAAFGALCLWTHLSGRAPSRTAAFFVVALSGLGLAALADTLLHPAPLEFAVCAAAVLALPV